jgi:hypothetical protein
MAKLGSEVGRWKLEVALKNASPIAAAISPTKPDGRHQPGTAARRGQGTSDTEENPARDPMFIKSTYHY